MSAAAARFRLLWPRGLLEWFEQQHDTSFFLVGLAISRDNSPEAPLTVAAVVGALNSLHTSAAVQDWLQECNPLNKFDNNHLHISRPAVLGIWTSQSAPAVTSNTQLQLPPTGPWIALHGSQELAVSPQQPQRETRPQRLLAPCYDFQHSRLPSGTTRVQVCSCSPSSHSPIVCDFRTAHHSKELTNDLEHPSWLLQVFLYRPAFAGSCMLVQQQQHQQHTSQPPWLVRPPGDLQE